MSNFVILSWSLVYPHNFTWDNVPEQHGVPAWDVNPNSIDKVDDNDP
jgi:hypothetical protein